MAISIKKNPKPAEAPVAEEQAESTAPTKALKKPAGEVQEHDVKEVVAQTTTKNADGTETTEQEVLGTVVASAPMANVGISMGMTRNIGDYNNVKYQVSLHIPCAVDPEEIEATYNEGKEWVETKLNTLIEELDAQLSQ